MMTWLVALILTVSLSVNNSTIQETIIDYLNETIEKETQTIENYQRLIGIEVDWLESTPLNTGAIPMFKLETGQVDVNPYFANVVGEVLIETKSDDDKEYVYNYINWYLDHINSSKEDPYGVEGTIFDYKVTVDGQIETDSYSKKKYDSIDSYAATFISLFNTYILETNDLKLLEDRWSDVKMVHSALLASRFKGMVVNNLKTYNRYLMDNSEAYDAINSTLNYFEAFKDTDYYNQNLLLIIKYNLLKVSLERQIENMWTEDNHYNMVIFMDDKVPDYFDWQLFYPDATSQLFPIIYSLIKPDSKRAELIYKQFNKHHNWENLEHLNRDIDGFYWGRLAYVAAIMNDDDRLMVYINNYLNSISSERDYPLLTTDTAWVIMAMNKRVEQSENNIVILNKLLKLIEKADFQEMLIGCLE